jgi:(p)ppGpp synthase/HD superfamily hydrolase
MSTLEKALEIAARAHAGRIGEDGDPEICHPLRLMLRLHGDHARQAAILHDVIEDCGMSAADLAAAGFSSEVIVAVETLTGRAGESYDEYISRIVLVPLAAKVKQADVEEHAALVAQMPVNTEQMARMANYQRARISLAAALA